MTDKASLDRFMAVDQYEPVLSRRLESAVADRIAKAILGKWEP